MSLGGRKNGGIENVEDGPGMLSEVEQGEIKHGSPPRQLRLDLLWSPLRALPIRKA